MNKLSKQAFTLIELLVVIVIIGILSSLIVVSMKGSINSANDTKRKSSIDSIRKVLMVYGALNWGVYPISSGCNIGPIGTVNRCTNLAIALPELDNPPVDPVPGYYYTYTSSGSDFNISSTLSSGLSYNYSPLDGYYTSVIARPAYYSTLNNKITATSYVDDSANGALWGYAANFTAGWSGRAYIGSAYGFQAGIYDIYVRVRTDGAGTNPTNFATAGIYDNTPTAYNVMIFTGITGSANLSTSYQVKYAGRLTLTQAMLTQSVYTYFSNSATTTGYYIDYIEFRLVNP